MAKYYDLEIEISGQEPIYIKNVVSHDNRRVYFLVVYYVDKNNKLVSQEISNGGRINKINIIDPIDVNFPKF